MSRFYGIVSGQSKTEATRRGSKKSGLTTTAASWSGAVRVEMWDNNGTDWCRVEFIEWPSGVPRHTIYSGPASGAPISEEALTEEKV